MIAHEGFERDPEDGQSAAGLRREPGVRPRDRGRRASTCCCPATRTASSRRPVVGKTWVSQPGRWGNTLTRFDVTLEQFGRRLDRHRASPGRNLPMKRVVPGSGRRRGDRSGARRDDEDPGRGGRRPRDAGFGGGSAPDGTRRSSTGSTPSSCARARPTLSFASLLPAEAPGLAGRAADAPPDLDVLSVRERARHGRGDRTPGARGPRALGRLRRAARRARAQLRHARRARTTSSTSPAPKAAASPR